MQGLLPPLIFTAIHIRMETQLIVLTSVLSTPNLLHAVFESVVSTNSPLHQTQGSPQGEGNPFRSPFSCLG